MQHKQPVRRIKGKSLLTLRIQMRNYAFNVKGASPCAPMENTPTEVGIKPLLFVLLSLFTSCSKNEDTVTPTGGTSTPSTLVVIDSTTTSSATPEGNKNTAADEEDIVMKSSFSSTVTIRFGSTVTISNPLATSGLTVTESGGDVIIKSTVAEVEYVLSGTSSNASVKIYSEKKFKLTLNGLNITNTDGPAINIQASKRVFLLLADNTINTLSDGNAYTASGTEDMKATLFSEGQLIISGNGSLSVTGNYKHAICSDEYVRVVSGTITVPKAVSDGIHTNDAFIADGGTVTLTASDDGIQCEKGYIVMNNGTYIINSVGKGIAASYDTDNTIDPYMVINSGTITVNSSAGEGIESKSIITINAGIITVHSSDDGINAGKALYINGGIIYSYATSNDGIDSNGNITITGGKIVSVGAGRPEEGFDCDRNTFKVTGGFMVGIGGATSSPTASVSTQPSVILGTGTPNQLIHIQSTGGAEALTFLVPRSYSTMLFSTPKLKKDQTYKIFTGGSVSNGKNVNGLYTSGTYTLGTQSSATFTTGNMLTQAGGSIGPG